MPSQMIPNLPMSAILGIGHFLFFWLNVIFYEYFTCYASSAPCPDGTQTFWVQRNLVVKMYNNFLIMKS